METKRVYEALFLVDSAAATAQWDHVMEVIRKIFGRAEAREISIRKWDERRLCYPIEGKSRGTYILAYFECGSSMIRQIERDVQLSEDIIRVMIVRTDRMKPEEMEKPTPAMLGHVEHEETRMESTTVVVPAIEEELSEDAVPDEIIDNA